jgi:hypothetical protein
MKDDGWASSVFVHELAHSMWALADEYAYAAEESVYCRPGAKAANISGSFRREDLPWKDLVAADTPLPTEPSIADRVGAHEGAGYCTKGMYRPQPNCLMRTLGHPFCHVCQREIDAYFARLDTAAGGGAVDAGAGGGAAPGCSVAWYNDGICDLCLGDDPDCDVPAGGTACGAMTSCAGCNASAGCGWCAGAGQCVAGTQAGPSGGACGDWRWLPSECSVSDPCALASGCDGCVAVAGCGWCATTGTCQNVGAGACSDWRTTAGACGTGDLCGGITTCDACSANYACGWCESTWSCVAGTVGGPSSGACADWRVFTAQCGAGPSDPCASAWTCDSCVATAGCGFCGDTGQCVTGDLYGPAGGVCSDWRGDGAACGTTSDPCASGSSCDGCIALGGVCGWCADTWTCTAGTSAGPASGDCGEWHWTSVTCSTPPADPCAALAVCADCTITNGCGYCSSDGLCRAGTATGPTAGTCDAWAWNQSSCP